MPHFSLCAGNLRVQFGHFERGDNLSCPHPVSDVDVDSANVAGYFCVQIYFLESLKLPGDDELTGKIFSRDANNRGGRDFGSLGLGISALTARKNNTQQ